MADVLTMRDKATAIAESALRRQRGGEAQQTLIETLTATLVSEGLAAQARRNGRELAVFERDFDKIAILVDALLDGNYQETATRLAGIASSSIRAWVKAAEDGDPRYKTIALLVQSAEAIAEASALADVRAAGKEPRNWAAAMTFLERRHPERFGRRSPEETRSGVTVIIGARAEQVQIGAVLSAAPGGLPPSIIDIPPGADAD